MSESKLPERPSLEFLKKSAKEKLQQLRHSDPKAKLADALLLVAREYGFPSWRALKAEVDKLREPEILGFFRACSAGEVHAMEAQLQREPWLAREKTPEGSTPLHLAVRYPDVLRLLIQSGADVNARDQGDNATPLHFAAGSRNVDSVRILLDAGADVHGYGDLHNGDVIGWAAAKGNEAVVELLLQRGAKHHIFSAMALADRDLVERLVEEDPEALSRRRSRFECMQTPVHAAFAPPDGLGFLAGEPDYGMLRLLIDLGADIDAPDGKGRTPLEVALLRGDAEATRLLREAGAREPVSMKSDGQPSLRELAKSIRKGSPMFSIPDMWATVRWYESIGFTVDDRYQDGDDLMYARVSFGEGEFSIGPGGHSVLKHTSLWFITDRVEEIYAALKARQLESADVRFEEDLYEPFYGGKQFGILDNNGLGLVFYQPEWLAPAGIKDS